ncbi:hypothetical protein DXG01_011037, partial [Tephrocybe rancida]
GLGASSSSVNARQALEAPVSNSCAGLALGSPLDAQGPGHVDSQKLSPRGCDHESDADANGEDDLDGEDAGDYDVFSSLGTHNPTTRGPSASPGCLDPHTPLGQVTDTQASQRGLDEIPPNEKASHGTSIQVTSPGEQPCEPQPLRESDTEKSADDENEDNLQGKGVNPADISSEGPPWSNGPEESDDSREQSPIRDPSMDGGHGEEEEGGEEGEEEGGGTVEVDSDDDHEDRPKRMCLSLFQNPVNDLQRPIAMMNASVPALSASLEAELFSLDVGNKKPRKPRKDGTGDTGGKNPGRGKKEKPDRGDPVDRDQDGLQDDADEPIVIKTEYGYLEDVFKVEKTVYSQTFVIDLTDDFPKPSMVEPLESLEADKIDGKHTYTLFGADLTQTLDYILQFH